MKKGPIPKDISKERLYELYIQKRMSYLEIANEFGVSKTTIFSRIKEFGIPLQYNYSHPVDDLSGKEFGDLTAIRRIVNAGWLCQCKCGNECVVKTGALKNGSRICCNFSEHIDAKLEHGSRWSGYGEISGNFFAHIRCNALKRKHDFQVSIEYIWNLFLQQNRRCVFSNISLTLISGKRETKGTASLDRIDSSVGYIEGNVQWVHKDINKMKNAMSDEKFVDWCCMVADYKRSNRKAA